MEEKINIAEILKNKPRGTILYSPICGECKLSYIESEKSEPQIGIESDAFGAFYFWDDGKAYVEGECLLYPSDKMRDWSKFAWKKGDVLVSNDSDRHIIFKGFSKNDYTTFEGKHWISVSKKRHVFCLGMQNVQDYHIEDNKDSAQTYINTIEEKLGGTLNRETLEIEKQYEFKDGDIAFADYGNRQDVFIVSGITGLSEGYSSFISIDLSRLTLSMGYRTTFFKKDLCKLRLATEEEKQQLFDALAKKDKAWDAEKKQIVDLKPKCEFKPFDKVLGRNEKDDVWEAELFSHYREESQYPFRCIGFGRKYCIPYNEETAHLLGTTDDWEGGEQ